MKLPPHNKLMCVGIDLYDVHESCTEPVEEGSPFPLCALHRVRLQKMPRKRACAGAMTYDAAFRIVKVECGNATGHPEERLCAKCRVLEKKHEELAREQLHETCPTCRQRMMRPRTPLAVPPKQSTPTSWPPDGGTRPGIGGPRTEPPWSSPPTPNLPKYSPRKVRPTAPQRYPSTPTKLLPELPPESQRKYTPPEE